MARLPGPPYLFLDRVMSSEPPPWKLEPDGWVETEYDVPPDAWYFRANRQSSMPFCVIQEIALQSCGWLAAYMGSALKSPADLSFRNLGGQATLHDEVFPDAGTLTSRVRLTNASQAGDTIIEEFEMEVRRRGGLIYSGSATFGFFSEAALARQVGIRGGKSLISTVGGGEQAASGRFRLDACPPLTPDDPDSAPGDSLALPARAMLMLDEVETLLPDGGPHGLGYIQGAASVDPRAWFFKAHFFQDPVWPGSLGLEAFLQLLKVFALDRWGEQLGRTHRFAPIAPGIDHRWLYRGQVTPSSRRVQVEAVVTERQDGPLPMLKASGFLLADGVAIYEIIDFGLSLCDNG